LNSSEHASAFEGRDNVPLHRNATVAFIVGGDPWQCGSSSHSGLDACGPARGYPERGRMSST